MTVIVGDCVEGMRDLEPCSVDAVVCDPPYGIGFMGKDWDTIKGDDRDWGTMGGPTGRDNRTHTQRGGAMHAGKYDLSRPANRAFQAWVELWATEALRVLKPGGHLLAFGGTRTYHRLAAGIEDAGFEIRDCLAWMYGSGFPKSLDVSKAIDARAGAERTEIVGYKDSGLDAPTVGTMNFASSDGRDETGMIPITAPVTDEARQWEGWGTALKPAYEPTVLARKPLAGTVAANVLAHGTGALNIDGTRIGNGGQGKWAEPRGGIWTTDPETTAELEANPLGRWPANVVLDEHAAHMLDQQTGELPSQDTRNEPDALPGHSMFLGDKARRSREYLGESGGASRFYYVAKASRAERNAGLDGFDSERSGVGALRDGGRESQPRANVHPTVKPVALMRWLVRLITPPGGTVLDPFTGSGTTGIAAHLENLRFLGFERDPDYAKIAEARIAYWQQHGHDTLRIVAEREAADRARAELTAAGQLTLEGVA